VREVRRLRYLPLGFAAALVFLALVLLTRDEPGFHLSTPDTSSLPAAATRGLMLADAPPSNAEAGTLPVAGALEPGLAQAAGASGQSSAGGGVQASADPPAGGQGAGGAQDGTGGQLGGDGSEGQGGGSGGQGGGGQGGSGGGQGSGGGGVRAGTATPELPSAVLVLVGLLPLGLAVLWLRRRDAAPGVR
jgi:hypothetical protein